MHDQTLLDGDDSTQPHGAGLPYLAPAARTVGVQESSYGSTLVPTESGT
jgi:hypothetical protein